MQIVDARIHRRGPGLPGNLSHWQVAHFTKEAVVLTDVAGVDTAIIQPPGWDSGSTGMAFSAVRDYPGRFAIMGSLPLNQPDFRMHTAGWRNQPGMLGLRCTFLHDPAWFGAEVTGPVRLHVAAKRYLCATEADYFAKLSKDSVLSLSLQGGPMSATEEAAFDALPQSLPRFGFAVSTSRRR